MIFDKRDPFSSQISFKVDVQNKAKGLVITVIESNIFYHRPEEFREGILKEYLPNYSRFGVRSKEDKKKLKEHFNEEIEKRKQEIERFEILLKVLSRKQIELIDESKKINYNPFHLPAPGRA